MIDSEIYFEALAELQASIEMMKDLVDRLEGGCKFYEQNQYVSKEHQIAFAEIGQIDHLCYSTFKAHLNLYSNLKEQWIEATMQQLKMTFICGLYAHFSEKLSILKKALGVIEAKSNLSLSSKEPIYKNTNEMPMTNPLRILQQTIEKVPFVKYALGITGVGAAIAIIKSFGIENYSTIPIISILVMLGFMVLLFLFASLTTVKDRPLKLAGYILVFTTVAITCVSAILLTTSVFISFPKPITEYGIFQKDKVDTSNVRTRKSDTALLKVDTIIHNPTLSEVEQSTDIQKSDDKYTQTRVLSMTSTQISNLIQKLDWTVYESEIINKWQYNDLVKLIYTLKMDIPVFNDKNIYYKSSYSNKETEFKDWTYENIKLEPKIFYTLWRDFMTPKEGQILVRLKNIKENPTLYQDKLKE